MTGQGQGKQATIATAEKVGIWHWNDAARTLQFDAGLFDILGYSAHDFTPSRDSWPAITHIDDIARLWEVGRALRDRTISYFAVEHRTQNRSGKWMWILTRGLRVPGANETMLVGTCCDITAYKDEKPEPKRSKRPADLLPHVLPTLNVSLLLTGDYGAIETQLVRAAVEAHRGNKAAAARALGMPRRTLYRRLDEST